MVSSSEKMAKNASTSSGRICRSRNRCVVSSGKRVNATSIVISCSLSRWKPFRGERADNRRKLARDEKIGDGLTSERTRHDADAIVSRRHDYVLPPGEGTKQGLIIERLWAQASP